jgi:hypothetical protein
LELARGLVCELFPNSFSISFSQAADWQNGTLFRKSLNLRQSAAWEKKIEKEFGNNSQTSPLASSKRLDSGRLIQYKRLMILLLIVVVPASNPGQTYRVAQRFRDKCLTIKCIDEKSFNAFNSNAGSFCLSRLLILYQKVRVRHGISAC